MGFTGNPRDPHEWIDMPNDPPASRRYRPLRWRFGAKRFGASSVAFQVDGHDLVHVSEIDADGFAFVIVYASSDPEAEVIFSGRINIDAHTPLDQRPS
jgi:hypothetical protein